MPTQEQEPSFQSGIKYIPIEDIEENEHNPRKKFSQEKEDELIESINVKGVLVPIIVYQKRGTGKTKYILLDGQRRVEAARKLGNKQIPAHIIEKEPTLIENISLMFHIHNVHEDWTDLAIVDSLECIIKELGFNRNKLTSENIKELKRITSLSEYKIKKFKDLFTFSDTILNQFKQSEISETPYLDVDLLSELRGPIKNIKSVLPEIIKKYPEQKLVDIFIAKKKSGVISANKEIRNLTKMIKNIKQKNLRKPIVKEKILDFLENPEISISEIYSQTAEPIEHLKAIIKNSEKMRQEIINLDMRKLTKNERSKIKKELRHLLGVIKNKISEFNE